MRRILTEAKLVKVEVFNDGNSWSMQWAGGNYIHRGDQESFAKLLRKIKAADDHEEPRSYRSERYIDIANEIASGSDRFIWVFEHMLKKLWEDGKMRKIQKRKMKEEMIRQDLVDDIIQVIKNIERNMPDRGSGPSFEAGKEFASIVMGSVRDDAFVDGMMDQLEEYV